MKGLQPRMDEIIQGKLTPRSYLLDLFGRENFITIYNISINSKHGKNEYPPFTTIHSVHSVLDRDLDFFEDCCIHIDKTKQYLEKKKQKKRHKIKITED